MVLPNRGAVPELLAITGGGHTFDELSSGLALTLEDLPALRTVGQRAREVVQQQFRAADMAEAFLTALG